MRSTPAVVSSWKLCVAAALTLSLAVAIPGSASAQIWEQTARLRTPIHAGPLEALVDTLVYRLERRDGATVQRRPDWPQRLSITALRDTLVDNHGIGIRTANTLFIDYRFELGANGQLDRQVTGLQFYFLPGPIQEVIPILYLDAREEWLRSLLQTTGTSLETNQAALIPFRHHLRFTSLAREEETTLVEIDGDPVREGFSIKKESLLRRLEELTYSF